MVIAFIPVRGGSKSIPLKNIKPFCGKPLVCWNIEALEDCPEVDEIIVATDSDKIEETVTSQSYKKTKVYRRSAENACDTASTESVMLEYIHYAQLTADDIFMLVQATSPLTETIHFTEALKMYGKGEYDSVLTCVRNYRFFWNEDGTSMNYDYKNRPRRQNFSGMLMENGAFYINKVAVALPDAFGALYLEVEAAGTGQGGVVGEREQDAFLRFQLGDYHISQGYLDVCVSSQVADALHQSGGAGGKGCQVFEPVGPSDAGDEAQGSQAVRGV